MAAHTDIIVRDLTTGVVFVLQQTTYIYKPPPGAVHRWMRVNQGLEAFPGRMTMHFLDESWCEVGDKLWVYNESHRIWWLCAVVEIK